MKEITTPEGECGRNWGLSDLFSQQFTGPFKAVDEDGVTELAPIINHKKQPDGTWGHPINEHANEKGGKVIDSEGNVVATTANHLAAHVIACTLNTYPTSLKRTFALGMGPYGCNAHTVANPWDFWAVQVDFEMELLDKPGQFKTVTRYIGPCAEGEYRLPLCVKYALHACKHRTRTRAMIAIEALNEMLKKPYIQEQLGKYPSHAKWETMKPVKIHYLTVAADPEEGTVIMKQKDGTHKRVPVAK